MVTCKCLPQDRWLLSPLSQHAPRSSKVSYLKWASGADWVMVTGDSRWGLGDGGQGFVKLDIAGMSVFPGQSVNLKIKKRLISKVKFKRACEVLVSGIPHMPRACTSFWGAAWPWRRWEGGLVPRMPGGHCWDRELLGASAPGEGVLWWLCCPGPPHCAVRMPSARTPV